MSNPAPNDTAQGGDRPILDTGSAAVTPRAVVRRRTNRFWVIVGWAALFPVMLVLALRWRGLGSPLTIAMAGLTPFAAIPLAAAVLGGWWSRSATLRATAGVTAVALVFTTSPVDALIGCGAETADDAITIYTANVLYRQGRPADVAASVLSEDADVVILQEVGWNFLKPLRDDERLHEYRYRSDALADGGHGTIIWSRHPFADVGLEPFIDSNLVHATIDGPTGQFTVTGLHTLAPVKQGFVETWHRQFDRLTAIATTTPRVAAGDFNATSDHQQFRTLLDSGWTDVHDEKGCGFDATWPVDGSLPLAVMRLDHVLVTEHFEVLDVRFGDPAGSDHKPVVASIRLISDVTAGS